MFRPRVQTGTAAEVSRRVLCECRRLASHLLARLHVADDYDVVCLLLRERLFCLVCSTTGRGEEPDNMKKVTTVLVISMGFFF